MFAEMEKSVNEMQEQIKPQQQVLDQAQTLYEQGWLK